MKEQYIYSFRNETAEEYDVNFYKTELSKIAGFIHHQVIKSISLERGTVNVVFVTEKKNKSLNKVYRNLDKVCESLAFCYDKDESGFVADILLTPKYLEKKYGRKNLLRELKKTFIHSYLHVFGFNHEEESEAKEMFALQHKIESKFGL